MTISSSAVLVRLGISIWTANKVDRSATDTVLMSNGASQSAGKFRKDLMAGTRARKDISDFAASCRLWHTQRTLPWEDRGARLLPTSLFLDYKDQINQREERFNNMVHAFLQDYDRHVKDSQDQLGTLFRQSDYPSREEVAAKFKWQFAVMPVPEAGHFVLDVPAKELADTRASCDAEVTNRLEAAMSEAWGRLYKLLSGMQQKLGTALADAEDAPTRRWHESFLTNATDLCDLLGHLNLTNDPKLSKASADLRAAITGMDVDTLKESPPTQKKLHNALSNILEDYEW